MLTLNSCKKNEDSTPATFTDEDLLTESTWTGETITYTDGDVDVTETYADILQTITFTFSNSDNTYTLASSVIGSMSAGTWTLNSDGTLITATDDDTGASISITVNELSDTTLHITFDYLFVNPLDQEETTISIDASFTHS
ncbi:MAG: hypothetical protein GY834_10485 [Bacteroidetes bacterium]|nr:hypothetical protein [Bacteroidota bacterium]